MKTPQHIYRSVKTLTTIVCVSALPVFTGFVATAHADEPVRTSDKTVGEKVDDTATTARVKKALANDAQYKFDDVNVSTHKGTVQLSGFANTAEVKNRAAEIAKKTEGVKDVKNEITVKK
jgi:hyperosmotically inducible protein